MTNPSLDVLKNQSFPEVSAALRSRSAVVMERWQKSVREVLPSAEELTLAQLRDHVPLLVDQIIEALEAEEAGPTDRLTEVSKPHGEMRFHQDYNVNELLIEYHLLRRIVFEEIGEQLNRELLTDEIVAINLGIDTALRRGVVTFIQYLAKQIQSSDDLQSYYISFLNHDLRGGMNGILLMTEVLKRELATEPKFAEAVSDLEAMRRAVLESVATMDRFVFAHRLGRGKYEARFVPLNIKTLINDLLHTMTPVSKDKAVTFSVDVADGSSLTSDPELLRLMLQNILGNTIKHARKSGGKVQITVRPRDGGGCVVKVTDEGPGIPPDQIGGLFSVATAPASNNKAKGAVRLGLAVSKQAADLIGATLTAESVLGVGTTITLAVPDEGDGKDPKRSRVA